MYVQCSTVLIQSDLGVTYVVFTSRCGEESLMSVGSKCSVAVPELLMTPYDLCQDSSVLG